MTGPRVPTSRELALVTVAVVYGLVWVVCAVLAIGNVHDAPVPPPRITPATAGPAVPYLEEAP